MTRPWVGDWLAGAACVGYDPDLFFPIGMSGPAVAQIEQAREVCGSCPARQPCLDWAMEAGMDHGIWGGLSEDERRSVRRIGNARERTRLR